MNNMILGRYIPGKLHYPPTRSSWEVALNVFIHISSVLGK